MGILQIVNTATGLATWAFGAINHLIQIKHDLQATGANYDAELKDLNGNIVLKFGSTIEQGQAYIAANPA